jgi:hypothetical protein
MQTSPSYTILSWAISGAQFLKRKKELNTFEKRVEHFTRGNNSAMRRRQRILLGDNTGG